MEPAAGTAAPGGRPLRQVAVRAIARRLARMREEEAGVLRGDDHDALRRMRVWSRRTRSALEAFRPLFPGPQYRRFERRVASLTRALGSVRDLDVVAADLEKRRDSLAPEERGGLDGLVRRLLHERHESVEAMHRALGEARAADLEREFEVMAAPLVRFDGA